MGVMYAERLILETDMAGNLKKVPMLPPNKQLEAIFLVISESTPSVAFRRIPHPDISGKVVINCDIMSSAPC
ncbi:MAG: hypothetical protein ACOYLR_12665 [Chlorobium sp.]